MPQDQSQNLQPSSIQGTDNFDPTQDIDISSIESEIVDTSRGDIVDYDKVAFNKVYRLKCLNCGFMYEGKNFIDKCPRCGSNKLDDSDSPQTT